MTTIDKLGLLGIRSYGTEKETFINFSKPLTIILGRNGSGKSTIIEAVKMATTGDLPPLVGKGAAFIHDPRIDNETETKAKVRLMFSNVRGDQYIVARHFQLTMRKGPRGIGYKPEFKTVDQSLKRQGKDGTSGGNTTYRCADLNALLPDVMRVTKPVLNNVIFVHQEDSFWPLGDPRKLKEKFDEIFAATRYTKALETIRKYRKDQAAEVKVVKAELMHYEDKVQVLEKVRREVDEIRVKHDELRKGVSALHSEIADLIEEKSKAESIYHQYKEKCNGLETLKSEKAFLERGKAAKYAEMELHLPDMDENTLRTEIDELQLFLDRADGERAKRGKLIEDLVVDVEMKRKEFLTRQNRRGMLEQQAKVQGDRLKKLDSLKSDFSTTDGLMKPLTEEGKKISLPLESASLSEWSRTIDRLLKDAENYSQEVSDNGNSALGNANTNLSNFKVNLQTTLSDIERQTLDINERRARGKSIRDELHSLEDVQVSIRDVENKLRTAEILYNQKKDTNRSKQIEVDILNSKKKVSTLREDLSVLRRTREQLVQDQSEQARFDVCRETAKKKKKQVYSCLEYFLDVLVSSILELEPQEGEDVELISLKRQLSSLQSVPSVDIASRHRELLQASIKVLARRDVLIQEAERDLNKCRSELHSASAKVGDIKGDVNVAKAKFQAICKDISNVKRELSGLPDSAVRINEVIGMFENVSISGHGESQGVQEKEVRVVKDTIKKVDTAVVKANQKISQLETGVFLAEEDLSVFETDPKHRCPACGISSSKKIDVMRQNLKRRVDFFKDPTSLTSAETDLKGLESMSLALRKLETHSSAAFSVFTRYRDLVQKQRETEHIVSSCKSSARDAEALLEQLENRFGDESAISKISSLKHEVKQAVLDYERSEKDVQVIQNTLSVTNVESRSLSEVDAEVQGVEDELVKFQDQIEKDSRILEREREDFRSAETRLHHAKQECAQQALMSERHKNLTKEKEEISKKLKEVEIELERNREKKKALQADVECAEAEFFTVQAETTMQKKQASNSYMNRQVAVKEWRNCVLEVEAYIRSGKETELSNLLKSLDTMEGDIDAKKKDLRAHEKEQETASDSQKDMAKRIRNLRDNQRYRMQEQELQVNTRSMRHLRDEIAMQERQAGEDPEKKVKRLTDSVNAKNAMRHATLGKQQVYTDRYKEKKKELEYAEKQGSRRKYDECRIRKQTMELASSDLEKYHRALDQALMAFHTLKMNSINRTIKELWQRTYRGTDIDEIEISSDNADAPSSTSTTLKRTFNYHVQMRQGQATLDMRGRCSAGQKVLACLVIRLALAENFCTECGILALDEPTTNLDRENVESLAAALKAIIEIRRKQRNFQLVLITHDQDFIDMIGARDFCSEYFMIYKDHNGISNARAQDIQHLL